MVNETLTFGRVGSRPYGQLIITETSVLPELNQSVISIQLVLKRPSNIESTATKTATCTINGQTYDWVGTIGGRGDKVLISKTQVIPHEDSGYKTIFVSASITLNIAWSGIWVGAIQGANAITLTKIPRYSFVTQSLANRSETSLTINWNTNEVIDRLWYSSNNGSTWTEETITEGRTGSYVIENLSIDAEYNVKTKVRRKSNQLISESSTLVASTYKYPYATLMPDFTIGDILIVGLSNPLNHTITVDMLDSSNNLIKSYETSGSIITGYDDTDTQNALYQSIPNSKRGQYKIRVTYNSHVSTSNGGYYSINEKYCSPTTGTLSYQDVNPTVVAITQDDQIILKNRSTVRYTVSGMSGAKYASIVSCTVSVNGNNYNLTISGSSASGGNAPINSGSNVWAKFSVTDSRGITAINWGQITILDYKPPTARIKLKRQSNYYTATDLTVHAIYSSINGHNAITITYRAKKSGDAQYTVTGNAQNNVRTTIQLDNQYVWYVDVTLTDSFGSTITYSNLTVSEGTPLLFIDRKKYSVGINCLPKGEKTFEINGNQVLPGGTITCNLQSNLTNPTTGSYTTIDLSSVTTTNGTLFNRTESSPSGAVVLRDINYVVVSASLSFLVSPTEGNRYARIRRHLERDTDFYAEVAVTSSTTGYQTISISPFVIEAGKNTTFHLQYQTPSTGDVIRKEGTWLTVWAP